MNTPPVLFMSPEGEVLGEVSNYSSTKRVLKAMLKVLDGNEKYNQPSREERNAKTAMDGAATKLATATTSFNASNLLTTIKDDIKPLVNAIDKITAKNGSNNDFYQKCMDEGALDEDIKTFGTHRFVRNERGPGVSGGTGSEPPG